MKLPKSWEEVPLSKYIEISEVSFVDMDEIDKAVKILSILSGQTEDSILDLKGKEILAYYKQVTFIFSEHKGKGVPTSIKLNGKRYHINNDIHSLCAAEYIDYTNWVKDRSEIARNLPNILAIFFQPIGLFGFKKKSCYRKNTDGDLIQTTASRIATAKELKDLPANVAMELAGFFLKSYESSMKATQNYLTNQQKKTMKLLKKEATDL